ncbi:hypothetical protein ACOBR2_09090 [Telmatobacter bradus]|uniref:hypothetical protein n=1 Tax=Telmatobacter bradus TaxID=474953 RepID=UPI003B42AEAC
MAVARLEKPTSHRITERFFGFWKANDWRGNLLLMLPFLALYCFVLARHEVWRDEINAWAIAYVSPNLGELLRRIHYEAHPALWYVILFAASRISAGVWMLKLVQGAIGTAIYLLLAVSTPLRRLELALIYGGYYIAFQYTVMCRMYGLEVLFALIYIWFRTNRPQWLKRNVLWLGLIANVDLTAAILATGLLLEYLHAQWQERRQNGLPWRRALAGAVVIYGAMTGLALLTLWPAKDISWTSTGHLFAQAADPLHLGFSAALWMGLPWYPQVISPVLLWPDLNFWPQGFWVTPILVLYVLIFRKHRREGAFFGLIIGCGILFSQATNVAGVRHIGIVYLAFLLALCMLRHRGASVSRWSYVLLAAGVLASLATVAQQWGRPFTDGGEAARWIEQQKLGNLPILGTPDTMVVDVTERLNKPVYQLDCNCMDRVMTFSRRRDSYYRRPYYLYSVVALRTAQALKNLNASDALLVLNFPLPEEQRQRMLQAKIQANLATSFERGLLPDEHFYIYRVHVSLPVEGELAQRGDASAVLPHGGGL